jgi:hypothetical protein
VHEGAEARRAVANMGATMNHRATTASLRAVRCGSCSIQQLLHKWDRAAINGSRHLPHWSEIAPGFV